MPYIKQSDRELFEDYLDNLSHNVNYGGDESVVAGRCNYVITSFLKRVYSSKEKLSYRDYNEIIGILESAKLEFYRRSVVPYENEKIEENGDV
jgi:hypothetical protein